MTLRQQAIANNPSLKPSTRRFWEMLAITLDKSWPELAGTELHKVTAAQCEEWAGKFSQKASASLFNNVLASLKQIFEIGVERGVRRSNPAAKIKRRKLPSKDLTLRRSRSSGNLWGR